MIDRREEREVAEIMHAGEGPVKNWVKILCVRPNLAEYILDSSSSEIAEYHAENLLRNEPDEDGCECYVAVKINETARIEYRIIRELRWKYNVQVLEKKA